MDHARCMGGGEGIGDRPEARDHFMRRQSTSRVQMLVQTLAGESLHHQVASPVRQAPEVEDLNDVGVSHTTDCAGFLYKAADCVGAVRVARVEHLDGDHGVDERVTGCVDCARHALADGRTDHIVADITAGGDQSKRWARRIQRLTWVAKEPLGSRTSR